MRLRRNQPREITAQLVSASAGAVATATIGAIAFSAVAIGRAVVRMLSTKNAHATRVSIDDLSVARVRVREFMRDDVPPPPIR